MTEQEKLEKIIQLVESSDLDPTIKEILTRDLAIEGLSEYMLELVKAYCLGDKNALTAHVKLVEEILAEKQAV